MFEICTLQTAQALPGTLIKILLKPSWLSLGVRVIIWPRALNARTYDKWGLDFPRFPGHLIRCVQGVLTMPPFEDSSLLDSCDQRGLRVLTAARELAGRQVAERTVRTLLVVQPGDMTPISLSRGRCATPSIPGTVGRYGSGGFLSAAGVRFFNAVWKPVAASARWRSRNGCLMQPLCAGSVSYCSR